jgi:hypothetical protein
LKKIYTGTSTALPLSSINLLVGKDRHLKGRIQLKKKKIQISITLALSQETSKHGVNQRP